MRIFSDRNCAIQPIDALGLLRIVHIVHIEDSIPVSSILACLLSVAKHILVPMMT